MIEILIVDDDKIILKLLSKLISQKLSLKVDTAISLKELKEKLNYKTYTLAICDYCLPDAKKGESVNLLLNRKIPTIVFTDNYDEKLREEILNKGVIDYLVKGTPKITNLIIDVIKRSLKNMKTEVLIIEDSLTDRLIMKRILESMLFKVFDAPSISQAKEILNSNPDIKLIILDYYLPEENTLEFIYELREKYKKSELGIIIVSGVIKPKMIPILLKAGANDFLQKPFSKEEFMVRVTNAIEMLDLIEELEFYAYKDPLTELYNRRYFFEEAPKLWNLAKRRKLNIACIIIDIDDFKKINDTYGHDVGDIVLKDFAKKLQNFFQREEDLLARIGGEEFVILVTYSSFSKLLEHLENFRKYIEEHPIKLENIEIPYTISIGVETGAKNSLKDMLIDADKKLYKAKLKGKNCIVY